MMSEIQQRYQAVCERITQAALQAGRPAIQVQLLAVSKTFAAEQVREVAALGQSDFGENYVQEAVAKWPALRARFGPVAVHMIGPLQTNKARAAVDLFDAVHTVDRASLAEKLAGLAQARGLSPKLFLQVNTGAEPQKAGVLPGDLDGFVVTCRALDLPLAGLMCIPPEGVDAEPHFAMLSDMARRNGLTGLSMGMSSDFETAIAQGATHVRVGSAIFGARKQA